MQPQAEAETVKKKSAKASERTGSRGRPRKPPEKLRTKKLSIVVTDSELNRLHDLAEQSQQTLADYVVCQALKVKARD